MRRTRIGNALLEWTDSDHTGTHRSHDLRVRLQDLRPAPRVRSFAHDSADYTSRDVVTIGSGVHEALAVVRWDDLPQSLAEVLLAGSRGLTLTYYPDADVPTRSWDVVIVNDVSEQATGLEDLRGLFGEHTVDLRLRRSDGSRFGDEFFTGLFYYYVPGQDLTSFTFTRSSTARYRHLTRVINEAASGKLRDYHHVEANDGTLYRTVRLEGSRTNSYTRSEALDHADWSKSNVSITSDDTEAPDGETTMDKVVEDDTAAGSEHSIAQTLASLTDDEDQSVSAWGQDAERRWVAVRTTDKAGNTRTSWVDLQEGAKGTTDSGHTVEILETTKDSVRFSVTWNAGSGSTTPTVEWLLADADGSVSYDGDGSSGLYLWGMQHEQDAPFASSYIPTTDSAVTRASDFLQDSIVFSPADIEAAGGLTVYTEWVELGTALDASTFSRWWQVGGPNAGSDPRLMLVAEASSGEVRSRLDDGTSSVSSASGSDHVSFLDHVRTRALVFKDGSDWKLQLHTSVNGGVENSHAIVIIGSSLPADWSADTLTLGASPSDTQHGFTGLRSIVFAPGVKTLAEMEAMAR